MGGVSDGFMAVVVLMHDADDGTDNNGGKVVVIHRLCYTDILSRRQCGFLSYALGNAIVMLSFLSFK